MDFFNNQDDNTKLNEALLDQVMEEHKRREEKQNIKKGYLLSKSVSPVNKPHETNNGSVLKNENTSQIRQTSEPLFVVGGKKYSNNPKTLRDSKPKIKRLVLAFIVGAIVVASIFIAAFLMDTHKITFVCGNIEGVIIYDDNNKAVNELTTRMYEEVKFKIELKANYSQSDIQVFYSNVERQKDADGFYKIKYVGESDEIRIMGVMQNKHAITLKAYNSLKIYTKDDTGAWSKDISNTSVSDFLDAKLRFKVYDTQKKEYAQTTYVSVYADNQLITPNDGVYEVTYTKNINISAYVGSPFECFKITDMFDPANQNSIIGYRITGLTSLGEQTPVLCLPTVRNGLPVTYSFVANGPDITVQELVVNAGAIKDYSMFNWFDDLQKITVIPNPDSSLYSENGILYNKVVTPPAVEGESETTTIELVRCPNGYGKWLNEGERIVTANPDVICENAFYKLNYIKTINLGANVKTIKPLAFKGGNASETYAFNIVEENPNFKVVDNVIYSKDGSVIISAQQKTGEFHVENGKKVSANAFTYGSITKLVFDGEAEIEYQGIAAMGLLQEIVLPSNLTVLSALDLFGNFSLKTINLSNISTVITINEWATVGCDALETIIVPDDLFETYKTTYSETNLADLFKKVSEI